MRILYMIFMVLFILLYAPLIAQTPTGNIEVMDTQCYRGGFGYVSVCNNLDVPMDGLGIPLVIDNPDFILDSVVQIWHNPGNNEIFGVIQKTSPLQIYISLISFQSPIPVHTGEIFRIYFHVTDFPVMDYIVIDTMAYDAGYGITHILSGVPAGSDYEYPLNFNSGMIELIDQVFICGDINNDNQFDLNDLLGTINYIFGTELSKMPRPPADVNCDYLVNFVDVIFMVNNLFRGGPAPCELCD